MMFFFWKIRYHNSTKVLFADDNGVPVHFDLYQLYNGPDLLILTIILQHNTKMFQASLIGGDGSHLIRTSALEVVALPIKGHKMRITRYHTRAVVDRIATSDPLHHLALLPGRTAGPLGRQTSTSGARVALGAAPIAPEGGSGFHIVTLVHAAALRLGDTLDATVHEAVVTDTRLHTGGVAFGGTVWVCTCSRTGTRTELIVTVFWALWCSCVDKEETDAQFKFS